MKGGIHKLSEPKRQMWEEQQRPCGLRLQFIRLFSFLNLACACYALFASTRPRSLSEWNRAARWNALRRDRRRARQRWRNGPLCSRNTGSPVYISQRNRLTTNFRWWITSSLRIHLQFVHGPNYECRQICNVKLEMHFENETTKPSLISISDDTYYIRETLDLHPVKQQHLNTLHSYYGGI